MNGSGGFRFPFQDAFQHFLINPVTSWSRFFNPQFFINYNAGDVEVENSVLSQVGSYGKQLGKMQDVLEVLVARLPVDDLTPRERRALDDFRDLSQRVKAAVAQYRPGRDEGLTTEDVDRLIEALQSLARSNPDVHRKLLDRLGNALQADAPPD